MRPQTLTPDTQHLTPKQQLALAALLQGGTQAHAARHAGCSERSIRGWLKSPPSPKPSRKPGPGSGWKPPSARKRPPVRPLTRSSR